MDSLITKIRLINRALIHVKDDPIQSVVEVMELCRAYNIACTAGYKGVNDSLPFITNMYLIPGTTIEIEKFDRFLSELQDHLDFYNGFNPFTIIELHTHYKINHKTFEVDTVSYFCTDHKKYNNLITDNINPVIRLNWRSQNRISKDEIDKILSKEVLYTRKKTESAYDESIERTSDGGEAEGNTAIQE